eukprot:SAG22_NODE_21024_length_260_cov_1.273292_1_plen_26_part_10
MQIVAFLLAMQWDFRAPGPAARLQVG